MGAARVDGASVETVLHLMDVWVEKSELTQPVD